MRKVFTASLLAALALAVVSIAAAANAPGTDSRVTVGNGGTPFSQNKQNEPAVAVNAFNPLQVAAGSNDEIDLEACNAGDPTTCPFTQGVGVSGIYVSADGGSTYTQPTYQGFTARDCLGPNPCTPHPGPIGTLPGYFENGLVSDGDPALAFGPLPDANGTFSWTNGQRLYYANLTSNFSSQRDEQAIKGFEGVAVSRSDDAGLSWADPVVISKQNAALFSDKEAVWADNASSSRFFGNVYVCNASFRAATSSSPNAEPEPILFTRSTDGGVTFEHPRQLSAAVNNSRVNGRQDCTVRTDRHGTVYIYWIGFDNKTGNTVFFQDRSFDGGATFERPRIVIQNVIECGLPDPTTGRLSVDGVAGAREGSAPSVDIANGAPTGSDATDEILLTWCQGPTPSDTNLGPNETAEVAYSTNGGGSFTGAGSASPAGDRPFFPAIAISPDGTDAYVTYTAFLQPWQHTTAAERLAQGVVLHADVTGGTPGLWSELNRAPAGDARGSAQNNVVAEFLGDYNYVVATRDAGIAVWNDVRGAADCSAVDAYRQSVVDGSPTARPAPGDCPATFGNSDIFGGSYADPTP